MTDETASPAPGPTAIWPLILRITGPATCFETAAWSLLPVLTIATAEAGFSGLAVGLIGGALPAGLITMLALLSNEARLKRLMRQFQWAARLHPVTIALIIVAMAVPSGATLFCAGLAAFITGCLTALLWTGSDAALLEYAPRPLLGRAVALHEIIRSSGLGLGPLAVALLGGEPMVGLAFVIMLSTAGAVLATVYALPNHRPMPAPVISAGIKTLPAVVLLAGLGGLLESIEATEFPAYAMALGASTAIAAGFAAAAGLGNLAGQFALGVTIDRRPDLAFIVTGLTIPAGLMLFLLAGGGALAFAPLAILGAASGALYTLAVIISASHGRGQGMVARAALAYTAGATVGPPLGAALSLVDQQLAMPIGLAVMTIAVFVIPAVRQAATRAASAPG